MKRLFCICLALILSLGITSCTEDEASESLKEESSYTRETVSPNETEYIYGTITDKTNDGMLVMKVSYSSLKTDLGNTVHIVTDQADKFCVKDEIKVAFSVIERPYDSTQYVRIIADDIVMYVMSDDKPIIYFYPEVPTLCSARVILDGKLTCTYPEHGKDGWKDFTAYPDGTLVFPDGKEYYALYWEGLQNTEWDFSKGFCVRGEDTAEFLEWVLEKQGLTPREANEFIIYWLPLMQDNPYNVISFQTAAYTESAVLEISPAPDSLLRVFMAYYPTDTEIDIEPQTFEPFVRKGFTVVEWGGSRVERP